MEINRQGSNYGGWNNELSACSGQLRHIGKREDSMQERNLYSSISFGFIFIFAPEPLRKLSRRDDVYNG